MLIWIKRLFLTATFLVLVASNLLTLTSTTFNAAMSGLLGSALGVRTVSGMLQSKLAVRDNAIRKHKASALKRKAATRRFGSRLAARTQRVAAKSIAALPAESIPFLGVAVLIADTGYELYAACETISDLDQLYADLDMSDATADDVIHSVCDPQIPPPGHVWDGVVEQVDQWWGDLLEAV